MSSSIGFQRVLEFFWDKELENLEPELPIVILGKEYQTDKPELKDEVLTPKQKEPQQHENPLYDLKNYINSISLESVTRKEESQGWPPEFLSDVYTKLWFTYRTKFTPLKKDKDGPSPLSLNSIFQSQNYNLNNEYFTTDCGWGCMIRTGQTLLANSLLFLYLGRDWRYELGHDSGEHNRIVSWFLDTPDRPFSIHKFVEKGNLSGKKPGEWFGPSATARSIQALCSDFDSGLKVYIGSDSGDIYEQDLLRISKDNNGVFTPTLILLGIRLGIDNVNTIYWENIKQILSSDESVGISGGRPSSSHYFFGYQGDYLFYLDPHQPQTALEEEVNLEGSTSESTDIISELDYRSVHTKKLRKLHLSEVDPSMLVGVLIKTEDDWVSWKTRLGSNENKIIHILSNQSISHMYEKRPSFVIVGDEGDDFIDVGLEPATLGVLSDPFDESIGINIIDESELQEQDQNILKEEPNAVEKTVILLSKDQEIEELVSPYPLADCPSLKEEDFENIAPPSTAVEEFDDSAVEISSLKQEEPFEVVPSEI